MQPAVYLILIIPIVWIGAFVGILAIAPLLRARGISGDYKPLKTIVHISFWVGVFWAVSVKGDFILAYIIAGGVSILWGTLDGLSREFYKNN